MGSFSSCSYQSLADAACIHAWEYFFSTHAGAIPISLSLNRSFCVTAPGLENGFGSDFLAGGLVGMKRLLPACWFTAKSSVHSMRFGADVVVVDFSLSLLQIDQRIAEQNRLVLAMSETLKACTER